jgi:1-acyl-sn-glycerol-3-phosphate acyltransferase
MVDLEYLKRIKLVSYSVAQKFIGTFFLGPNYNLFAHVDIRIENHDRIPRDENVIYAMNHTDRFNYWPFQYKLWRMNIPETTVWVKGKYYRNPILARGLDFCNLIPVPSMGYLIQEFYRKRYHRAMDRDVYRRVKDAVDDKQEDIREHAKKLAETAALMGDTFVTFMRDYYEKIMERVAEISNIALCEKKLSVIIFPEGTRGSQLGEGKTGIAQLALHTGKKVVPVACNNSDRVYPGASPVAKSGWIIYRVGEPLSLDGKLKPFRIDEPFKLLSRTSQIKYREKFEGATRVIMAEINAMLDDRYRGGFASS